MSSSRLAVWGVAACLDLPASPKWAHIYVRYVFVSNIGGSKDPHDARAEILKYTCTCVHVQARTLCVRAFLVPVYVHVS